MDYGFVAGIAAALAARFDLSPAELTDSDKVEFLESLGLVWQADGRLGVTGQGMPVLDAVLAQIVPDALAAA